VPIRSKGSSTRANRSWVCLFRSCCYFFFESASGRVSFTRRVREDLPPSFFFHFFSSFFNIFYPFFSILSSFSSSSFWSVFFQNRLCFIIFFLFFLIFVEFLFSVIFLVIFSKGGCVLSFLLFFFFLFFNP